VQELKTCSVVPQGPANQTVKLLLNARYQAWPDVLN
jgi:hypothetical protein